MIAAILKYKTVIAGVLIVVMALTIWLLWGQVGYARDAARASKEQVTALQTKIDALAADQKRTSDILTARLVADRILQEKLAFMQKDLNEVITNDKESADWAAARLPGAILKRLHD